MDIVAALHDHQVLGFPGRDPETWRTMDVCLKAAYGLEMAADELECFRAVSGGREPPSRQVREFWAVAGRSSGKSRIAAAIVSYQAAFTDWRRVLSPGEDALAVVMAVDRDQAGRVLGYVRAYFHDQPMLRALVIGETARGLRLSTGAVIEITTASFRSIRGATLCCAILDEVAFWRDEYSRNPDREIFRALKPGLNRCPGSILVGISTPWRQAGLLFDRWKRHFGGDNDRVLVVHGSSRTFNPTLDEVEIAAESAEDPVATAAEYEARWRADVASLIDLDALQSVIVPGRYELPPSLRCRYKCFVDPSGGRSDSFVLAVAHYDKEGRKAILDCLREFVPPFSPEAVVSEIAAVVRSYGSKEVTGDAYGAELVIELFAKEGISYHPSKMDASSLYLNFVPRVMSGQLELLDNQRMQTQFLNLERSPRSGGREKVEHPRGQHDDLANAVAGAISLCHKTTGRTVRRDFWDGTVLWDSRWSHQEKAQARAAQDRRERNSSILSRYLNLTDAHEIRALEDSHPWVRDRANRGIYR